MLIQQQERCISTMGTLMQNSILKLKLYDPCDANSNILKISAMDPITGTMAIGKLGMNVCKKLLESQEIKNHFKQNKVDLYPVNISVNFVQHSS